MSKVDKKIKSFDKVAISRSTAKEIGDRLDDLSQMGSIYIVDPVIGPSRLLMRTTGKGKAPYLEIKPGVLTTLDADVTEEVVAALNGIAKKENILVLSMYAESDVDSFYKLAVSGGDRVKDVSDFLRSIEKGDLDKYRGKTIVIVGHVEEGGVVARNADGTMSHRLDIKRVESIASNYDVTIVGAGCSSYCNGNKIGYHSSVTDFDVADSVEEVFNARTLGDVLGAFGKKNELIVSGSSLSNFAESHRLELSNINHSTPMSPAVVVSLYRPVRSSSVFSGVFEVAKVVYSVGLLLLIFMYKDNRCAFLRVFPKLPSPEIPSGRGKYPFMLVARETIFFVLSPVYLVIVFLSFFIFGLSFRKHVLSLLWGLTIPVTVIGLVYAVYVFIFD